ncbi:hypothetical protein [Rhodococcus sp. HS-D2]|uniref:hypothetical protein n=1 Tax=Rhodococcus sp. HS-D2 TaxID=1384636 RepID=UPI0007D999A2|nr:hypothetical protein [Rhodococcus sp. HS-D2]
MNLHPYRTAQRVLIATRKAGATVPAPIAKAEARAEKIAAYTDTFTAPELRDALVAAIDAGREPTTDPHVAAALNAQQLHNEALADTMRTEAGHILTDALTQHDIALIDAWRTVFDTAAAALHTAHEVLGDIDLNNAEAILRQGGDAADVWTKAKTGIRTIDTITQAWVAWAQATRLAPVDGTWQAARITDADWHTWHTHKLGGSTDVWAIVRAGAHLDLADANTYRQRVDQLTTERAAEATAAAAR